MADEQTDQPAIRDGLVQRVLPAYRQVADQLRALILKGEFKPGERLPVEADLCDLFGVSRGTLREALRELSAQSLVSTTRGAKGGTFVAEPDAASASGLLESQLGHMSGLDMVSLPDMLEVREMLEIPIARLAAERRTDEHLEQLRATFGLATTAEYRATVTGTGPPHFHTTLLHAAGNPLLSIMTPPVFRVLSLRHLQDDPPEFWKLVSKEHEDIAAAVADRDADAAAEMMRTHLCSLRKTYEQAQAAPPRTDEPDQDADP